MNHDLPGMDPAVRETLPAVLSRDPIKHGLCDDQLDWETITKTTSRHQVDFHVALGGTHTQARTASRCGPAATEMTALVTFPALGRAQGAARTSRAAGRRATPVPFNPLASPPGWPALPSPRSRCRPA